MMPIKLATTRSACRLCNSLLHRRTARDTSLRTPSLAHGSGRKACCSFLSTLPLARRHSASSITHSAARLLSTSTDRNQRSSSKHHKPHPTRANLESIQQQVRQLEHESKEFLKSYKTMNASHKSSKFQHLLTGWSGLMNALSSQPQLLRSSVHTVDSLAHLFLDQESTMSTGPDRVCITAAQLVNPAIFGWSKLQRTDPEMRRCHAG